MGAKSIGDFEPVSGKEDAGAVPFLHNASGANLLLKDLDKHDSVQAPWIPAKWRVVHDGVEWGDPEEKKAIIEVKAKANDEKYLRIFPVAMTMIPVYLVILYEKLFSSKSPRFVLRCLIPTDEDKDKVGGGINWLQMAWQNKEYRCNVTFRNKYTSVVVLEGSTYEGIVGMDDNQKEYRLKLLFAEWLSGDNDAVMRHNLSHGNWWSHGEKVRERCFPEFVKHNFCPDVNDLLIRSFVSPSDRDVCGEGGKVEEMDLVEDHLPAWARVEAKSAHSNRWSLAEGEYMVRQEDEEEFDVKDKKLEPDICAAMHSLSEVANKPPRGLNEEEMQAKKSVQLNGTLIDNLERAVLRVTNFSPLATIKVQLARDHYMKVLKIGVPKDVHEGAVPQGFPPGRPLMHQAGRHHREHELGLVAFGPADHQNRMVPLGPGAVLYNRFSNELMGQGGITLSGIETIRNGGFGYTPGAQFMGPGLGPSGILAYQQQDYEGILNCPNRLRYESAVQELGGNHNFTVSTHPLNNPPPGTDPNTSVYDPRRNCVIGFRSSEVHYKGDTEATLRRAMEQSGAYVPPPTSEAVSAMIEEFDEESEKRNKAAATIDATMEDV